MNLTIQQFLIYYCIAYLIELLFMVYMHIKEGEITVNDLLGIIIIPLSIIVIPAIFIGVFFESLSNIVIWRKNK